MTAETTPDIVLYKSSSSSDVIDDIARHIRVTPDSRKGGYQGDPTYSPDRGQVVVDYTDGDEIPIGTNLIDIEDCNGFTYSPDIFITINRAWSESGRFFVALDWEIA